MRIVVMLAIVAPVIALAVPAALAAPRPESGALAQAGPGVQEPGPYGGPGYNGPAVRGPMDWRMNRFRGGFAGGRHFFGVLPLLVIIGLIGLGFYAVTRLAPSRVVQPKADHALTILRERYARGEITAEDYEAMKRALG